MRRPERRGFTLLELLVAVMLLAVIATMLFEAFGTSTRVMNETMGRHEALANARAALDFMQHELEGLVVDATGTGMRGYYPATGVAPKYDDFLPYWLFDERDDVVPPQEIRVFGPGVYSSQSFQVRRPGSTLTKTAHIKPGSSVVAYHCATAGIITSPETIQQTGGTLGGGGTGGQSDPTQASTLYNYYAALPTQALVADLRALTHAWVVYFLSDEHELYRGLVADMRYPLAVENIELFAVNVVDFKMEFYDAGQWTNRPLDRTDWVREWKADPSPGVVAALAYEPALPQAVKVTLRVTDSRHIGNYDGVDDDGVNGVDDVREVGDPVIETYEQLISIRAGRE